MNNVRIVVADDHAVVRAGIANALRALANVKIVGEANDGRPGAALAQKGFRDFPGRVIRELFQE